MRITNILYVVTNYGYGAAFVDGNGDTLSDRRNDAYRAAHFRTARSAEAFAVRHFGAQAWSGYGVERIYKTEDGDLWCEVGETPGAEGTTALHYRGQLLAGLEC